MRPRLLRIVGRARLSRALVQMGGLSGLSFLLNLVVAGLGREVLLLPPEAAVPLALALVTVINFFACRHLVFAAADRPLVPQFIGFAASIGLFRLAEYGLFLVFFKVVHVGDLLSFTAALGLSFFAKFFFVGSVVFQSSIFASPAAAVPEEEGGAGAARAPAVGRSSGSRGR